MPRRKAPRPLVLLGASLVLAATFAAACGSGNSPASKGSHRGGGAGLGEGGDIGTAAVSGKGGSSAHAGRGGTGGKGGGSVTHGGEGGTPGEGEAGTRTGVAGADNEGGADSSTHDGALKNLGFDTNLGPAKDPNGNVVPTDYNPLRKTLSSFHPRAETYVAGTLWDQGTGVPAARNILFDDKQGKVRYAQLPFAQPPDDTWTNAEFKNGIAADVDGDGIDEIFAVYYVDTLSELDYVILDPDGGTFQQGTIDAAAAKPSQDAISQNWSQPSLARGDFDGSGRDQVAIGWFGLYIAKLEATQTLGVQKVSLDSPGLSADTDVVFVAAGDLDGDKNDELAVTYSTGNDANGNGGQGHVRIFDGTELRRDQVLTFLDSTDGWGTRSVPQSQVAIADIDGDHLGEVVFFGRSNGGGNNNAWQVFVMDDLVNGSADQPWVSYHYVPDYRGDIPHPFSTLDFNGDGIADIFAEGHVLLGKAGATPDTEIQVAEPMGFHRDRPRSSTGDIDGDGKDDIIVEDNDRIYGVGLNAIAVVEDKHAGTTEWQHENQNTTGDDGGWQSVILASCNVDRDSAVMRYDGDHELLFTDPHILALVSSPPYWNGVDQAVSNTTSTFGTAKSSEKETDDTAGFSVGFSVGYQTDFLFGSASFSVEVDRSFDYTAFQSHSFETSLAYTTDGGQDLVVFSAIPFDVYYYTIVSSPTDAEVGQKFTLNIPRKPQVISSDPDFFNERTGPNGLKIDAALLGHTLGDPTTYPTKADMTAISQQPSALVGDLASVPQSGTQTSSIDNTSSSGYGAEMDLSVTYSWEVSAKTGPTVGGSVGFNYGHSYQITTSTTTTFSGTVGAIPKQNFADHGYGWGIMAYPQSLGNERFVRLDYWVE